MRLSLSSGTRLGPYEILAPIGAGGMGEVYRAKDSKLDREVAVKVLPESVASNPDMLARFEREAKAVAALSHPNILAIFDYGSQDGVAYAVMELLSGQTLRDRLDAGALAQKVAVDYALQIAKGLSAAHERGIVHRDLKPENVFVTKDGHVKILDFGLAKRTEQKAEEETNAPTQSKGTEPGTVMGTMGYMSPEQVRGYPVDHRSDIFAFGTILYEMLSGRRAFKRETAADTMSAILMQEPPALSEPGKDVPVALDHVVRHCLEKDPGNRFQTAKDIVFALSEASGSTVTSGAQAVAPAPRRRRIVIAVAAAAIIAALIVAGVFLKKRSPGPSPAAAPATAGVSDHTIAVLPFTNMSEDKSNEYFSDGISEDLLNLLTKVPQLQVTARTSSFSFKGKDMKIPEIARQLHVAHVLEGSVRKAGNEVRVTAQLVDAATDTQLWSQSYDRKLEDVFKIQDEIAADVVKQLKVTLLGAAPKARQTDPEAYALYLQAVQLGRQFTAPAFQQSDALFRKALAIDPRYAPAWDGLARNFANETSQGLLPNKAGFAQAREAATKALAIDPNYAPANARLGWIAMFGDNDLAGAARHFNRALALDPVDLNVLGNSATLLMSLGRLDEALALEEAIVRRDPVDVTGLSNLGYHQCMAGRLDAAIASVRTALSLAPGRGGAHYQLCVALLQKGDAKGALAEIEQDTSEVWKMIGLPMAYYALGRKADSDAALATLIAKYEKDAPYNIAAVYAYRGEADKAFEWLVKAVEYGDSGLNEIVSESLFDKIHKDPRWLPFLRKIGKAPEQLAKIEFKVTLPK
ncbi:MAG TPA: protein kinase [Thermoanaerobaculia bacterium]|nr:protein kinase [Thermoanaerobaculia bacterium]